MKNIRQLATNNAIDVRIELSNQQNLIPKSKLSSGSVINKYPIILDGGKTIIFIADRSKEPEAREKYEMRKISKVFSRSAKPK
jgi:hypothetical protein